MSEETKQLLCVVGTVCFIALCCAAYHIATLFAPK